MHAIINHGIHLSNVHIKILITYKMNTQLTDMYSKHNPSFSHSVGFFLAKTALNIFINSKISIRN